MKISAPILALNVFFALFAANAVAATPQVAIGDRATCFLSDAGAVSCQGLNGDGQLAQPNTVLSSTVPIPVAGLTSVGAIEAGDEHFCALLDGGTVACWGNNGNGQIGDGSTDAAFSPKTVAGLSGVVALSALDDDTCAQLSTGAIKCWGYNAGQFGSAHTTGNDYLTPVDVPGFEGSTGLADGDDALCAIFSGVVKCQGNNAQGQSGQPFATPTVGTPTEVPQTAGAAQVAAGEDFTCARFAPAGNVKCWGKGDDGRLGIGLGDTANKDTPVDVIGLNNIVKLELGEEHACALRADGAAFCWGVSSSGQAAQDMPDVSPPMQVALGVPAVDIFAGYDGACALVRGGAVYCWGDNDYGGFGPSIGSVKAPSLQAGVDLVTLPQAAQSAALAFTGKAKLDKKRKNYTRSAKLTITPSPYALISEACAGTATATTSYRYTRTTVKRVKGKRKKIKSRKTKKLKANASLVPEGNTCVANFSIKKLPVKYLAGKKISLTASVAASTAQPAISTKASVKLPKVKKKKSKKKK